MKTLYESILSSTGTGKYTVGKHLEVDNIPCTVVKNDGEKVWLLSDVFTGTNGGKISFRSNDEINWANEVFYQWGPKGCNKTYFPKGWSYPNADDWKDLGEELYNYVMKDCHMIAVYMVLMKEGRKLFPFDMSTRILYHDDRKSGIRFAKILKIK